MTDTTQPPAETLAEGTLKMAKDFIMSADNESGTCMCGSRVDGHGIGDGHSPVDEGSYHAAQVVECIDEAIAALTRRAGGDAIPVATIADLQRRRASDLDAVVNLTLCLKEARDALQWYRDTVGRCRMMHAEGDEARNALHKDCGERAEKALAFRVPAREPNLRATPKPPAGGDAGDSPYVAGPIWAEAEEDDDCFTAEIQTSGGHYVVATVHGATRDEVEQRQWAIIAALSEGRSHG